MSKTVEGADPQASEIRELSLHEYELVTGGDGDGDASDIDNDQGTENRGGGGSIAGAGGVNGPGASGTHGSDS